MPVPDEFRIVPSRSILPTEVPDEFRIVPSASILPCPVPEPSRISCANPGQAVARMVNRRRSFFMSGACRDLKAARRRLGRRDGIRRKVDPISSKSLQTQLAAAVQYPEECRTRHQLRARPTFSSSFFRERDDGSLRRARHRRGRLTVPAGEPHHGDDLDDQNDGEERPHQPCAPRESPAGQSIGWSWRRHGRLTSFLIHQMVIFPGQNVELPSPEWKSARNVVPTVRSMRWRLVCKTIVTVNSYTRIHFPRAFVTQLTILQKRAD